MAEPLQGLTFDAEPHVYRFGARVIPSVTQVLGALGCTPDWTFLPEWYAERGRAIHRAVHLWLENCLDESTVDPAIAEPLASAQKAITELHLQPILVEHHLADETLWFAGTPDLLGIATRSSRWLKAGQVCGLDYKGTELWKGWDLQLGGYYRLWQVAAIRQEIPISIGEITAGRYAGLPLKTGEPKWLDVAVAAEQFKAAVTLYHWHQTNGGR